MKILKEKYLKNIGFNKKLKSNKSNDINANKKRKISIVSTLDTQNSKKYREKSNSKEFSNKELEMIQNYRLKRSHNINKKEIPSFKGSSLPIFLSSMTNTKNNLNLINNKFKLKKGNNSNDDKSLINYSTLINNSIINSQKNIDHNNKSISIQNRNKYKKFDLKINFPKLNNLKLTSSRNIKKYNLYNTFEDKKINIQSYKNINNFNDNNNSIKNYKNNNYSMDNNIEKYFLLNKKLNDFKNNNNQSRKKLQNILYKRINEKILKINDDKIKNNSLQIKSKNSKKIIHNIMNINNKFFSNESKNNNNINNNNEGDKNKINNNFIVNKTIIGLKKNINPLKKMITMTNSDKKQKKPEKKRKKERKNTKKFSYMNKKKQEEKQDDKHDIKIIDIIPNNKININNENNTFLNEVTNHNDETKKDEKLIKCLESFKMSIMLKEKYNLNKFILKNNEKLKNIDHSFYNFTKDLQEYEKSCMNEIYNKKIVKYKKTYLELKKKSILLILLFSYINYINKCCLDNNLINYVIIHVEFSSIYLPKATKGQILITKKLFSLKKKETLFYEEKSKFIEKNKNKKIFQHMTLNFITKELFSDNIDSIKINDLLDNNDTQSKKEKKEILFQYYSSKMSKKKISFFRNNSIGKKLNRRFSIYIEQKSPQKSISLLQHKKFFKIDDRNLNNDLKKSVFDNLLYYKFGEIEDKESINNNKQYIQKIISLIHENKLTKKINNTNIDYYELLRKIKGKENIEIIIRTLIKEGEILLFNEYFHKNLKIIDINCKDEDGNSFLILSVKLGINLISKILLEAGIDVNIQDNEGNSALHYALSGKNYMVADILKKYGAKEDCYNKYGLTPWDCVSMDEKN